MFGQADAPTQEFASEVVVAVVAIDWVASSPSASAALTAALRMLFLGT